MNTQEMQDRLPKYANQITEDTIRALSPIYCLLDFDKNNFCKLVEAIGLNNWMEAAERGRWERLQAASDEYAAKEQYERDIARLNELIPEQELLQKRVQTYRESTNRRLAQ